MPLPGPESGQNKATSQDFPPLPPGKRRETDPYSSTSSPIPAGNTNYECAVCPHSFDQDKSAGKVPEKPSPPVRWPTPPPIPPSSHSHTEPYPRHSFLPQCRVNNCSDLGSLLLISYHSYLFHTLSKFIKSSAIPCGFIKLCRVKK